MEDVNRDANELMYHFPLPAAKSCDRVGWEPTKSWKRRFMHPALFLVRVKVACYTTTLTNFTICLGIPERATIEGFLIY